MIKILRKKWLRVLLIVVLVFIILQLIPPSKVVDNNPFLKEENKGVLIAAHRGGKHLNPENTFKAFDYAVNELNIDILEFDLVMTKDGHLISIHDDTINATSDVELITGLSEAYYVKDHTLEELLMFNFGYNFKDREGNYPYRDLVDINNPNRKEILKENNLNIVTIDEIFARYHNLDLLYIVEIKDSGTNGKAAADHLNNLLSQYNLYDKVTIGTFNNDISKYLRKTYPQILRGGSVGDVTGFVLTQMLGVNLFYNNGFANLQIPTSYDLGLMNLRLDKVNLIKRAHRRKMSVQYWTINDKEEMRRLIDLGADVIMTDSPDVLYDLLVELGYR